MHCSGDQSRKWLARLTLLLVAQEAEAAQRDVVEQAEARVTAAEQEAVAEREQRRRIMEAAANGNLPLVSSLGMVDPHQTLARGRPICSKCLGLEHIGLNVLPSSCSGLSLSCGLRVSCIPSCAGDAPMSPNGESFSHTELYMKYVEATTQCRQERLAKRQIEIMLEQVGHFHDATDDELHAENLHARSRSRCY